MTVVAFPRLDIGFEAALDGDHDGVTKALIHRPLIELVSSIAVGIQELPENSQVHVLEFLMPAVSAWSQVEQGWMVFHRLPWGPASLDVAVAQYLGPASKDENPVLASFACHVLAGFLAGEDEEMRVGFLNRAGVTHHDRVTLDALEEAPVRGRGAVSWMIDVTRRHPGVSPAVLADACEERFGTTGLHSQTIELLRLLGYSDIWKDSRSGFLADCLRTALLLGDAVHSTSPDDLHLAHEVGPGLSRSVRDEVFATDVLQAVSQRLICLLTPDRVRRMPQSMDRYLLLARLANVLADGAIEQRTKEVCAATVARVEPQADKLNREVYSAIRRLKEYHQVIVRRARRKYVAFLLGWMPVTVLWSDVAAGLPGGVQHILWPVFIWFSVRSLRSLAEFRTVLSIWPSVLISLLYVVGYVAGRVLFDHGPHFHLDLASQLTLGTVIGVSSGFWVALVSIAVPKRGAEAVIEILPEGLPDDWQDAAGEELSKMRP
jgi:hypothetical protein